MDFLRPEKSYTSFSVYRLLSAIISGILRTVVIIFQSILEGNSDAEYQVCYQARFRYRAQDHA